MEYVVIQSGSRFELHTTKKADIFLANGSFNPASTATVKMYGDAVNAHYDAMMAGYELHADATQSLSYRQACKMVEKDYGAK